MFNLSGIRKDCIESFLKLEHMGWKGGAQTSLRSSPSQENFFSSVVDNLGSQNVYFSELLLDDNVIASTVDFRVGDTLFAFKSSYSPKLAKYSIGVLNEIYLLDYLENSSELMFCDSGAVEGSYMDSLWPDRDTLFSGIWGTSVMKRATVDVMLKVREIKNRITVEK